MSYENRKRVYDELVFAGKFDQISKPLLKEFGNPQLKHQKKKKPTKKKITKRKKR